MERDFAPKIEALKNQPSKGKILSDSTEYFRPPNSSKQAEHEQRAEISKEDDGVAEPSKRAFMLWAAAAMGVTLATQSKAGFQLLNLLKKFNQHSQESTPVEPKEETTDDTEIVPTDEKIKSISEIVNYDMPEQFSFDKSTNEKLKAYWKSSYQENPNLKNSLSGALERINPWQKRLQDIFAKEGVPKHLAYLAIPESHFMINAHSPMNAVGPYQFTIETAQKYKLKVQKNNDERKDPLKSAHACAKLLKDLHKVSNDWDISLSAYNGGFAWKYLNAAHKNKEVISYEDFLEHLSNLANDTRNEIKNSKSLLHTIKDKENLGAIALKYHLSLQELLKYNHLNEKSMIRKGKSLLIPLSEENKRKIFERKIAGLMENLNYPARCNAIFELIKERKA
jgi:hypothetical protein